MKTREDACAMAAFWQFAGSCGAGLA